MHLSVSDENIICVFREIQIADLYYFPSLWELLWTFLAKCSFVRTSGLLVTNSFIFFFFVWESLYFSLNSWRWFQRLQNSRFVGLFLWTLKIVHSWDFPGGPMVKILPSNAGDTGWIPFWGNKIPHAVGRPSLCTRYWDCTLEPMLQNKRSLCASTKSLYNAVKTQHRKK